jgi:Rieske Fe-S protein
MMEDDIQEEQQVANSSNTAVSGTERGDAVEFQVSVFSSPAASSVKDTVDDLEELQAKVEKFRGEQECITKRTQGCGSKAEISHRRAEGDRRTGKYYSCVQPATQQP